MKYFIADYLYCYLNELFRINNLNEAESYRLAKTYISTKITLTF